MASKELTVQKVFDSVGKSSPYQLWICFVCFLVMFLDGFDGTVLGVATPKIAEYLHTNMAAMGVAGSAGSIGPFLGAVLLGMAADRWGRKWMLFSCCLVFGIFSFLTIYVTSVEQLTILRFIAGIGMGGAIPNALAFGSEYAPSRSRRTFVASMYAGVPMGATVGGLVSAWLIPHFGWQSLFLYGGIVPVFIAFAVAIILPESLEFLAGKGGKEDRMRKILARTSPEIAADKDCKIVPTNVKLPGVPFTHLFKEGRASVTLLFWITLMGGFYSMVVLIAWTPTLLHKSGASVVQYSLAFAALNFGAVVASIAIGRLMDKGNPFRLLKVGFVLSFVSLVVFGIYAGGGLLTVIATSIICGIFVNGSFTGLLTITTITYPPDIRGTGTGWAYAVGRIGAVLAPIIGGILLHKGWSVTRICTTNAFVGLFVAFMLLLLQWRIKAAAAAATK